MEFLFNDFVFINLKIIIVGVMLTNILTELTKKLELGIYGTLQVVINDTLVVLTITAYFVLYKNLYQFENVFKIIFETIVLYVSILIGSKLSYDTVKCYINKLEEIFKKDK